MKRISAFMLVLMLVFMVSCGENGVIDEATTGTPEGSENIVSENEDPTVADPEDAPIWFDIFDGSWYAYWGKDENGNTRKYTLNFAPTDGTFPKEGGKITVTFDSFLNLVLSFGNYEGEYFLSEDQRTYYLTVDEMNEYIETRSLHKTFEWVTVDINGESEMTLTIEPNTTGKARNFAFRGNPKNPDEHFWGLQLGE